MILGRLKSLRAGVMTARGGMKPVARRGQACYRHSFGWGRSRFAGPAAGSRGLTRPIWSGLTRRHVAVFDHAILIEA